MASTESSDALNLESGLTVGQRMPWHRCAYRLLRIEYALGLWLGAIATLILWYQPKMGPSPLAAMVTFTYAGLLYLCGFVANAVGDHHLDERYESPKREIAQAVGTVGINRLRVVLILLLFASLTLGFWVNSLLSSSLPLALGIVGVIAGVGYSLPPLRWKTRGFLSHAITLGLSAFFMPVFLLTSALSGHFSLDLVLLASAYTLSHYGMEIGNQLADFDVDRQLGILTLPSRYPARSCVVGLVLILTGLMGECLMLSGIFHLRVPEVIMVASILILTHIGPVQSYVRFLNQGGGCTALFRTWRYARWQTAAMLGYIVAALTIRLTG